MSPLSYYLLFFGLLGGLIIVSRLYRSLDEVCRLLAWLLLTIFSGLRVGPGRDYFVYLNAYTDPLSDSAFFIEWTWSFVNYVCRDVLGMPFHFWLTLVAGATYGAFFHGLKRWGVHWTMGVLAFVLIHRGYFETMNAVRQCLAMALAFVGMYELVVRRYWAWVLWILLAACFHTTALICLIVFPLALGGWPARLHIALLLASFLAGALFFGDLIDLVLPLVPKRYQLYFGDEMMMTQSATGFFRIFLNLVALGGIYLLSQAKDRADRRSVVLLQMLLISIYIYNALSAFGPGLRMMLYPFMAIFALLPLLMHELQPRLVRLSGGMILFVFAAFMLKDISNPAEPYAYYQTVYDRTTPTEHMRRVSEERPELERGAEPPAEAEQSQPTDAVETPTPAPTEP